MGLSSEAYPDLKGNTDVRLSFVLNKVELVVTFLLDFLEQVCDPKNQENGESQRSLKKG